MRVGLGPLRDVTIIDGTAEPISDDATKDSFAAKHGWDPPAEPRTVTSPDLANVLRAIKRVAVGSWPGRNGAAHRLVPTEAGFEYAFAAGQPGRR